MCDEFQQSTISNFMKISSSALKLLHAERQTDMAKLIASFLSFSLRKCTKKYEILPMFHHLATERSFRMKNHWTHCIAHLLFGHFSIIYFVVWLRATAVDIPTVMSLLTCHCFHEHGILRSPCRSISVFLQHCPQRRCLLPSGKYGGNTLERSKPLPFALGGCYQHLAGKYVSGIQNHLPVCESVLQNPTCVNVEQANYCTRHSPLITWLPYFILRFCTN